MQEISRSFCRFRGLLTLAAPTVLAGATACVEQGPISTSLGETSAPTSARALLAPEFESLRERIGDAEEVNLQVYFIGFPPELERDLQTAVTGRLARIDIVDAKPWWIPNMPRYGEAEFATKPAPAGLPTEIVPPDGLIRYDAVSFERDLLGGWVPKKELVDLYDDWHANVDMIYYAEHGGSLRDVPWKVGELDFHFLPDAVIEGLYPALERGRTQLDSANPPISFTLYPYNELFDWLEQSGSISPPKGGAAIVFLDLARLAGTDYSYYAEPSRDLVDITGATPVEVQYPSRDGSQDLDVGLSDLMATVLGGGLTQAKMHAALEVECAEKTTAAQTALHIDGMLPDQSLCARWELRPIRNLQGNQGRLYFVSDATELLAEHRAGRASRAELIAGVEENLFELYRYGVLPTSIKGNVFSEVYELSTVVLDLRYSAQELCMVRELDAGTAERLIPYRCGMEGGQGEQTYRVEDVFDVELAKTSLAEFAPGQWQVDLVDFPLGQDPVVRARTKRDLRSALPNALLSAHAPLYRRLTVPTGNGNVQLTSSWEKGIDFIMTQLYSMLGPDYDTLWPGPQPVAARPFHETGAPLRIPHLLILTPAPGGPLGELWGPAPVDFQLYTLINVITDFGGGGFWASVGGNELGGMMRRDFMQVVPQYNLGPRRGAGDSTLYRVMPDGTVEVSPLPLMQRSIDFGAPHWCNEFDSADVGERAACRSFVRNTTTLQSIETIQHGLGYMHAPEPRLRYHYDGELSSIARTQQLNLTPADRVGRLLHRLVNQYTTAGVSTVWGQDSSEWNGVGPAAGMQATLFRSHAREVIESVESLIQAAGALHDVEAPSASAATVAELDAAVAEHASAVEAYIDWSYRASITAAVRALGHLDRAFTEMGEPDRVYTTE